MDNKKSGNVVALAEVSGYMPSMSVSLAAKVTDATNAAVFVASVGDDAAVSLVRSRTIGDRVCMPGFVPAFAPRTVCVFEAVCGHSSCAFSTQEEAEKYLVDTGKPGYTRMAYRERHATIKTGSRKDYLFNVATKTVLSPRCPASVRTVSPVEATAGLVASRLRKATHVSLDDAERIGRESILDPAFPLPSVLEVANTRVQTRYVGLSRPNGSMYFGPATVLHRKPGSLTLGARGVIGSTIVVPPGIGLQWAVEEGDKVLPFKTQLMSLSGPIGPETELGLALRVAHGEASCRVNGTVRLDYVSKLRHVTPDGEDCGLHPLGAEIRASGGQLAIPAARAKMDVGVSPRRRPLWTEQLPDQVVVPADYHSPAAAASAAPAKVSLPDINVLA